MRKTGVRQDTKSRQRERERETGIDYHRRRRFEPQAFDSKEMQSFEDSKSKHEQSMRRLIVEFEVKHIRPRTMDIPGSPIEKYEQVEIESRNEKEYEKTLNTFERAELETERKRSARWMSSTRRTSMSMLTSTSF